MLGIQIMMIATTRWRGLIDNDTENLDVLAPTAFEPHIPTWREGHCTQQAELVKLSGAYRMGSVRPRVLILFDVALMQRTRSRWG